MRCNYLKIYGAFGEAPLCNIAIRTQSRHHSKMSNIKDIAEHGTALCAAVLPFLTGSAAASGMAAIAVPAATLTAIGYTIWGRCGRRAYERASDLALAQLRGNSDFPPEDLDRAALLLRNAPHPVDISPFDLRQAAAAYDFDYAIALRLTNELTEPDDNILRNILMPVFKTVVSVCRRDADFHRNLTQDLLIDAARQNGIQLELLESIDRRNAIILHKVENVGEKLDAIAAQSRDTLEAIALRFGKFEPEHMPLEELRGFLIQKARDYRALTSQIEAIEERDARLGNLKVAAKDAIARADLEEVEALLSRVDEVETEIAAETKLMRSENALLRGRVEEAYRHLSAAADSFSSVNLLEPVRRRLVYGERLREHGLRYGNGGLRCAAEIFKDAINKIEKLQSPELWGLAKHWLGLVLEERGEREDIEKSIALFRSSIEAYKEALSVLDDSNLLDRAGLQNNLAVALQEQARRTPGNAGAELLAQAVEAYQAALSFRTEKEHSLLWAETQSNLGNTMQLQAARYKDEQHFKILESSISAYQAAISHIEKEKNPNHWADFNYNLGASLYAQGKVVRKEEGIKIIERAIEAYNISLQVCSEHDNPVKWARAMEQLGKAYALMANNEKCLDPKKYLEISMKNFEAALRIYSPENFPERHKEVSKNIDLVHKEIRRAR